MLSVSFEYVDEKRQKLAEIDKSLYDIAYFSKSMYPSTYHDNINAQSVDPSTYLNYVARNNDLCKKLGIQYILSVIKKREGIFFTTSTSPSHDITKADHAVFFQKHLDPDAFDEVFATMQPTYSTFQNEWGSGRMVLIPFQNRLGEPYAFGASISKDDIHKSFKEIVLAHLIMHIGLTFVCALFVIGLRAFWRKRDLKVNAVNEMKLEIFDDLAGLGAVSNLGGWAYDPNEDYLYWSDKTYEIHEVELNHPINVDEAVDFYEYKDQPRIRYLLQRCLLEHDSFDETFRIITAKGQKKTVRTTGRALLDETGKVQLVFGSFLDISSQKQIERELKIYRNIIEQVPIPVFGICEVGTVIYSNQHFKDLLGDYRNEQFETFMDDSHPKEFQKYILNLLEKEKSLTETLNLVTKSGITLSFLAYFFKDEMPAVDKNSYFVMLVDSKDFENLKKQNEMLVKELNHRIKNELQVLSSLIGLSISVQKEKNTAMALAEIQAKIQTMSIFQEELGEQGHYQRLDLVNYFSRLIKNYAEKHTRTKVRYERGENAIVVDGKRGNYLGLLVNELLTNSFKHNHEENELSVFISLENKDRIYVIITYSDGGKFYSDTNLWDTVSQSGIAIVRRLAESIDATVAFKKDQRMDPLNNYCLEIKIQLETQDGH